MIYLFESPEVAKKTFLAQFQSLPKLEFNVNEVTPEILVDDDDDDDDDDEVSKIENRRFLNFCQITCTKKNE